MGKEDLLELGLDEETVNKVIVMHGKTIEKVKTERDDAINQLTVTKEELTKREQDFNELKETSNASDELKEKLENLTAKYDEFQATAKQREQELKLEKELELAIAKSGTIDDVSLKANLDLGKIELTEEGITGLDEQINSLKESKSFLFDKGRNGGLKHDNPPKTTTVEEDVYKAMGIK